MLKRILLKKKIRKKMKMKKIKKMKNPKKEMVMNLIAVLFLGVIAMLLNLMLYLTRMSVPIQTMLPLRLTTKALS